MRLSDILRERLVRSEIAVSALTGSKQGVVGVDITAAGSGYGSAPTVTIEDPSSGTTATATAYLTGGGVSRVIVTNPGDGYDPGDVPTVTFGSGSATAVARVGPVTLDAITTALLPIGVVAAVYVSGTLSFYRLCSGTDAESSPDVIRPDDYAGTTNEKVWKLMSTGSGGSELPADAVGHLKNDGAGVLSWEAHLLNNLAASSAPTANEDSGDGYAVGSRWIDTTADKEYVCLDATPTAAVWTETTGAGTGEANTASNVGTGDGQVFKQKSGVDLELKTIKAGSNVTVTNNASDITIASTVGGVTNKLDATADPTVNEDSGDGYAVGSFWVNVTDDRAFILVDSTVGAAVWKRINEIFTQSGVNVGLDGGLHVGTAAGSAGDNNLKVDGSITAGTYRNTASLSTTSYLLDLLTTAGASGLVARITPVGLGYNGFNIAQNASSKLVFQFDGDYFHTTSTTKVGINTSAPGAQLAVNGGVAIGVDTNPGDNNLLVDGTVEIDGGVLRIDGTTGPYAIFRPSSGATDYGTLKQLADEFIFGQASGGNRLHVDLTAGVVYPAGSSADLGKSANKFRALYLSGDATIHGVAYVFPSANAAGVLTNDGSGGLSWAAAGGSSGADLAEVWAFA